LTALGGIIEFIEKGRVLSAVVVGQKGQHYQVLTENAREMTVNPKRVLHSTTDGLDMSLPRHEQVRRVKERSQRREAQMAQVNAHELWELLLGEGESFDAAYLSELAFGDRDSDHVSATFRALFEEKTHFRLKQDRFAINTPEQLAAIIEARERETQRERLLAEGAAWLKAVAAREPSSPPEFSAEVIDLLKGEAISGRDFPRHSDAAELLGLAGLNRPETPFDLLVALGVWGPDENLDIYRLETPTDFPPMVETEADAVIAAGPLTSPAGRRDLRDLPMVTIDSPTTRDYDDALSVEMIDGGVRVGIHITDVSAYIGRGSQLEKEVFHRGATIYLPEGRTPMLPAALSEGLCSLKAEEVRPAISLFAEVSPEGDIRDYELVRSLIRIERQLTYEEVDTQPDQGMLALLDVARGLRRRRVQAGALVLPIPEVQIRLNGGVIGVRRLDTDAPSRAMVSEMMILANTLAARALSEAGMPAIFRAQDEPRERLVKEGETDLFTLLRQCRMLSRAEWVSRPQPHSSLGAQAYTSLTSPIRRAVDLLVQRQVAAMLGEGEPQSEEELLAALSRIEEALRRNVLLEQRRVRYWLLRYLERHVGECLEALVLSQWARRFQVVLLDLLLEGELPLSESVALGQRVRVRVDRVDARRDLLALSLVS
jgi:exoribonuclease-2